MKVPSGNPDMAHNEGVRICNLWHGCGANGSGLVVKVRLHDEGVSGYRESRVFVLVVSVKWVTEGTRDLGCIHGARARCTSETGNIVEASWMV